MTTFILIVIAYSMGFWWGKKVGIAFAMSRMQGIIEDMQRIQSYFKDTKPQWNEDNL